MREQTHVWELVEVELTRSIDAKDPYTEVEVWVDLTGPDFERRVYGFWDGGSRHVVRLVATAPGEWNWTSGSNVDDPGLSGRHGSFRAIEWSAGELAENPCRRGFLRPSDNGHGFCFADGTPHFYLGDTWWAGATFRHPWVDADHPIPEWPRHSFQDLVAIRRRQGFNGVAMIAAFPPGACWERRGRA